MPRITQTKIQKEFSFSTGSWLHWSDESKQPEEHFQSESEESQSIDSDHSSDFWYHWSPEIDRMIIARRATHLKEFEEHIQNTTKQVNTKIEQQRSGSQINELNLLGSILKNATPTFLERIVPYKPNIKAKTKT